LGSFCRRVVNSGGLPNGCMSLLLGIYCYMSGGNFLSV
jgi:hypothetical protein